MLDRTVQPQMPPGAYQTYQLFQGRDTTMRAACQQVGCQAWLHGWDTILDETNADQKIMADYIRHTSGRTFKETRTDTGLTVFRFEPYQRCFAEHRTRPVRHTVWRGDFRENQGGLRVHTRGEDWVEDFAEHQQNVADRIEKG